MSIRAGRFAAEDRIYVAGHTGLAGSALLRLLTSCGYRKVIMRTGEDQTIRELADLIRSVVGYSGTFSLDTSKPDGTFEKRLDVSRLKSLGWSPKVSLADGIRRVYSDFGRHCIAETRARA